MSNSGRSSDITGGAEARALRYVRDVRGGRIPASKWTRLAVERHHRDLMLAYGQQSRRRHGRRTRHPRSLWFDRDAARHALSFFRFVRHSKGEWAGEVFCLSPWQAWILWTVFGWKRADETRRFRTAYIEVARKNGKSTMAAAVGLYLLVGDGEAGAEIYSAATIRDQAKIVHVEAQRMVRQSPDLSAILEVVPSRSHINYSAADAYYSALGAEEDNIDGLNPHGVVKDELHAWKKRDKWEKLVTAMGARRQPLDVVVTTAGDNRASVGWEQHSYSEKVLDGVLEDDAWFAVIYCVDGSPDAGDDWRDEACWPKSNPNLDVCVKRDYLREQVRRVEGSPASLNSVLRYHFGVWTSQTTRFIPLEKWDLCAGGGWALSGDTRAARERELEGRRCFAGLDLATTTDVAAFVMLFPAEDDGEPCAVVPRFWVPEENIHERVRRDRVDYDRWVDAGLISATPGNIIDYRRIVMDVETLGGRYNIERIMFDRWGAIALSNELTDRGYEMIMFGQGFASMSAPTRELETMVLGRKLDHGGHPVLRWMIDNLAVRTDPAGNLKPDREKSSEKIDGAVALVMAIGGLLDAGADSDSVYSARGILRVGD